MGIIAPFQDRMNSIIPEIETIIEQATANENRAGTRPNVLESQGQTVVHAEKSMGPSDYMVAFSGFSQNYCVGLVDMADSTKISANLHERDWCKYYAIFLNSMAKILQRFGGTAIKNGGDSLLYYFPESANSMKKYGFLSCLECSLAMIESHDIICKKIQKEGLPPLNYRVSADYGKVVIMNSNNSSSIDVIGPPVNMCAKINHRSEINGIVVGGDMYQMVKEFDDYCFKPVKSFSIGLKYSYPIYSMCRKAKNGI